MLTHHVLTCNWVLSDVVTKATPNSSDIAHKSQGVLIGPIIVVTQTQRAKVESKSASGPGVQNVGERKVDRKDLHDPDNHDGVITHLEPEILKCETSGP